MLPSIEKSCYNWRKRLLPHDSILQTTHPSLRVGVNLPPTSARPSCCCLERPPILNGANRRECFCRGPGRWGESDCVQPPGYLLPLRRSDRYPERRAHTSGTRLGSLLILQQCRLSYLSVRHLLSARELFTERELRGGNTSTKTFYAYSSNIGRIETRTGR